MQRIGSSINQLVHIVRGEACCSSAALQWLHQGFPGLLFHAPFGTINKCLSPGAPINSIHESLLSSSIRPSTVLPTIPAAFLHISSTSSTAESTSAPSAPQETSTSSTTDAGNSPTSASPPSSSGRSASSATSTSKDSPPRKPSVSYGARMVQPWRTGGQQVTFQEGIVHVNNNFNNCIISLTDMKGNVKAWTSCGTVGFKNAAKSKPLAAEKAAEELARKAIKMGFTDVIVRLKGMGRNKQHAVASLNRAGLRIKQLQEITPVPYNGCRMPRKRRT